MTDNSTLEKGTTGRKWVVSSILFLLLVVLPAGSWYYLQKGWSWRKKAQAELRDFGKAGEAWIIYPGAFRRNDVAGKVCYTHIFGQNPDLTPENKKILDDSERIYAQFREGDNVRCVHIIQGGTPEFLAYAQKLPNFDYWVRTGGIADWQSRLEKGMEMFVQSEEVRPFKHYYALSDTSGTIRRYYDATDDKQIARMIEHIAMLMPK